MLFFIHIMAVFWNEKSASFWFLEGENSTSNLQPAQAVGKRPFIYSKSVVWDYFKKLPQDSDKAQCNICSESLKHSLNTSNLFKVCKQCKIRIIHECQKQCTLIKFMQSDVFSLSIMCL